jgi:hypothetical protein
MSSRASESRLGNLEVGKVEDLENAVLITARSRAADAACRPCGLSSARVSSRYRRRHDLAAGGRPVTIDLEVRRFFCGNPECELRTFAEQVPEVAQGHQHRTPPQRSEGLSLLIFPRPFFVLRHPAHPVIRQHILCQPAARGNPCRPPPNLPAQAGVQVM